MTDVVAPPSVAPEPPAAVRPRGAGRRTGWLVAVGTFVLYAGFALLQHARYRTSGYDLGLNYQLVQSYARFQTPHADVAGAHLNLLGDHFSPVMALLAPVYWVWPDPRALLLAQALLVALSVIPVHRVARRHLRPRTAGWVALGYAIGWPLQTMAAFDVHEVMFAVPLIAWSLDALDRRADRTFLALCAALLLVKEDMGLLVVSLGLVRVLLEGRSGQARGRRAGYAAVALGLAGYAVATMLVIPHLSSHGGLTHWTYDALGPDLPSALAGLVRHPLHAVALFVWSPPVKLLTLDALFVPTLLVAFRSPFVIATLPLLAERFFSSYHPLWAPFYHYSATAWPIIVVAAIDGARRLEHRAPRVPRAVAVALVGTTVAGTLALPLIYPLHGLLTGRTWAWDDVARQRQAVVAAIPAGTCVEADDRLVPHLLTTNRVSEPGLLGRAPDFVALNRAAAYSGVNSPRPSVVEATAVRRGYTLVLRRGDQVLYRSPDYAGPSVACRP